VALTTPWRVPWRVHGVLSRSRANGPGLRFVIWSQGCSLGCPGCFNPETHDPVGPGTVRTAGELADGVLSTAAESDGELDGVTLTGGEPLEQPAAVAAFCREVTARSALGIVVLTGFTRSEIERDPAMSVAVAATDMVVAGRYNARRHVGSGLRGSANKEYWARTGRYCPADFGDVPDVEILVEPGGDLVLTGLPANGEVLG
jgi:anaerobic ribonucleoside-triphosphate reductase activating protein